MSDDYLGDNLKEVVTKSLMVDNNKTFPDAGSTNLHTVSGQIFRGR